MAEYIERETAIKNIKEHQCRNCSDIGLCENCAVLTAIKLFENIPAVDVQPVLRCKDCKEWHRNYLAIDGGKHGCELFQDFTRPDDFCSFGTRMDGET